MEGQAPQSLEPTEAAKRPAAQLTHWVPPVVSLYVPAAQEVQMLAPAAE
jgi:hypothetical protein